MKLEIESIFQAVFKNLVASHVTEPGLLLIESGAVIKLFQQLTQVHACYKWLYGHASKVWAVFQCKNMPSIYESQYRYPDEQFFIWMIALLQ